MSELLDQTMAEAVADTFENLAFMEVIPTTEVEMKSSPSSQVSSSMLILEPIIGDISLALPMDLAVQIATTIYNQPSDEITPEMIQDIVAEFLNTLGGKFLNDYLAPGQMYSLGTPEPGDIDTVLSDGFVCTWCFQAEEKEFTVTLSGDGFGGVSE